MAKRINDFNLEVIGNLQKTIIDNTDCLNDKDIEDIYIFLAHWLLTEITSIKNERG